MMRSVNGTNSANMTGLPMTRNMPFTTASVPSRNQPRNMTGIYLGLEGNIKPPKTREIIPPLIRSRASTSRIRTPTEDRRYKMVENLRIKEEVRGFRGKSVKSAKRAKSVDLVTMEQISQQSVLLPPRRLVPIGMIKDESVEQKQKKGEKNKNRRRWQQNTEEITLEMSKENLTPRSAKARQWGPGRTSNPQDFGDIIRTNPRNYTVVINNGVTRSENLTGLMSFAEAVEGVGIPLPEALLEEVHRISSAKDDLAGLEECYKKVCRGNIETLHSLLPLRRQAGPKDTNFSTGFTVRSYRNPTPAEIMADFESQPSTSRPKTVPVHRQPLVPAPYFFKYYNNKPVTAASSLRSRKSPASQFEDQFESLHGTSKVIASPGAGSLSRNIKYRKSAWSDGDSVRGYQKNTGTPRGSIAGDSVKDGTDGRQVQISMQQLNTETDNREEEAHQDRQETQQDQSEVASKVPTGVELDLEDKQGAGDGNRVGDKEALSDRSGPSTGREERDKIAAELEKTSLEETVTGGSVEQQQGEKDMDGRVREGQEGDKDSDGRVRESAEAKVMEQGQDIKLGVETEDGTAVTVKIDIEGEPAEENVFTDDVDKLASQAKIASIKENAEQRKREFEKILNEHAQIVQQIRRQSSSGSEEMTDQRDQ